MIETISHNGGIIALILRARYRAEGIKFLTPETFSQQLGYMSRPRGYVIAPHVHRPVTKTVQSTMEVLFVKSGRVRADFYDQDASYVESRILNVSDVLLLASGGHGFEMLEGSEIIEVKQGPYAGELDKTRFSPIATELIRIVE